MKQQGAYAKRLGRNFKGRKDEEHDHVLSEKTEFIYRQLLSSSGKIVSRGDLCIALVIVQKRAHRRIYTSS